jgi:hypothetical protein
MHDHGEHGLAAEIGESSHAPVVRIEVVIWVSSVPTFCTVGDLGSIQ